MNVFDQAARFVIQSVLHFQVAARTLREEDAASTLEAIATGETARCLLGLVSLMRGGASRVS
jgi:hypothetical protein